MMRKVIYLITIICFTFLISEILLRIIGYKPFIASETLTESHYTCDRPIYEIDSTNFYNYIPGKYTMTYKTGYSHLVTVDTNHFRITSKKERANYVDSIWILGCSFMFGYSLNDEETMCWKLQEKLNSTRVINMGGDWFGTVHSLIRLEKILSLGWSKPKYVILGHADFHKDRNLLTGVRSKELIGWNKLKGLKHPNIKKYDNYSLKIEIEEVKYPPAPLIKKSALINLIDESINNLEIKNIDYNKIDLLLLQKISSICRTHNIQLIILDVQNHGNLNNSPSYLYNKSDLKVKIIDLSPDYGIKKNTNLPHDGHPSTKVNQMWADSLYNYITKHD